MRCFSAIKRPRPPGQRTQASLLAQDIYNQLTRDGHRVFFSRITLEKKLGQEYEPYIFAALHSASVMLVVGTAKEEFEAPWVANEWRRFLALAKEDESKILIPCYRDIDAYMLPQELLPFQGQDMAKIGAMQDLLHGVEKLLEGGAAASPPAAPSPAAEAKPLLERAFILIEDQQWSKADRLLEDVLNREPKNARAYIGKLLVSRRKAKVRDLFSCQESFAEDANYRHALEYGSARETAVLRQTCSACQARLEQQQLDRQAQAQQEALRREQLDEAVAQEEARVRQLLAESRAELGAFQKKEASIRHRQPLASFAMAIDSCFLGLFGLALAAVTLNLLQGNVYLPSTAVRGILSLCLWLAWLTRWRQAIRAWRKGSGSVKYAKSNLLLLAAVLVTTATLTISSSITSNHFMEEQYTQATAALAQGDYGQAAELFTAAGVYEDSREKYQECQYQLGQTALAAQDFEAAILHFRESGGYLDSVEQLSRCVCLFNELPADDYLTTAQAPWFSLSGDGMLSFEEAAYTGDGVIVVPSVYDGQLVRSLSSSAFRGCKTLTHITVSGGVKEIKNYAFEGCSGLLSLTLQEGVETLGDHLVQNDRDLQELFLPSTITTLGIASLLPAYSGNNLTVYYSGTQQQWEALTESSSNSYYYTDSFFTMHYADPADAGQTTEE